MSTLNAKQQTYQRRIETLQKMLAATEDPNEQTRLQLEIELEQRLLERLS
ncbi:MAG: hypothetical protein AAFX90_20465 [Pseudomonadota bacterium]